MTNPSRRRVIRAGAVAASGAVLPGALVSGGPRLGLSRAASPAAAPARVDWSRALVDSTMRRFPDGAALGGRWVYTWALYLYGQYLVYRRTGNGAYLAYIKAYVDAHVDANGNIDTSIDRLDNMYPGNLLLALYAETGGQRYRIAADRIRARLDTYPRTSDGGFWHATTLPGQLWLDGTHMVLTFLVRYGRAFNDSAYANAEAARQLTIYGSHLESPSGLYFHAYDETGHASWADPVTHHSPVFWGRGTGWYAMAIVETLENMPASHPAHDRLVGLLRRLLITLRRYQDGSSGRWLQVIDQGSLAADWTETSASSMFTYAVSRALLRHHVGDGFDAVARRGYRGVTDRISLGADGLTQLAGICVGTDAGASLAYYLGRAQATNDPHGLGAFLIMNEQLTQR
jgi:unsaturated rhamnogalacturonyl hydrolase